MSAGALRDTVLVPAEMGMGTIGFDADNFGKWALHCRHLYHMDAGTPGRFCPGPIGFPCLY